MDLVNAIPKAIRKQDNIVAEELAGYECILDKTIYPPVVMMTGGFCISFPLECPGKQKKCLRVWIDDEARKKNIDHIFRVSSLFLNNNIKYVIPYKYVEKALRLHDNTVIPGVIMDWIDGLTLMRYVKENYKNSLLMRKLADNFYQMVQYHKLHNIAHGDLSDENIIVKNDGEICLIDYDSFYINDWDNNIAQSTPGVSWYQHPNRMNGSDLCLNCQMDYFSQQVLYLSLLVIADNPQLFNKETEKGLIFKDEDFNGQRSFHEREIFKKIFQIRNSEIHDRLLELDRALSGPLAVVRSITDYENTIPVNQHYIMAGFCGRCGHHFLNQTDIFCPDCGKKRETLKM